VNRRIGDAPLPKRKRPNLGPAALRDHQIPRNLKWIGRPQYEAAPITYFDFFFGAFFFLLAMMVFLDV
jgi:hypothetical protein